MTKILACIPARGGSQRLPGKNLRTVGGVPLVVRAIDQANAARAMLAPLGIELTVCVSTDDAEVSRASARTLIIPRPAELATSDADGIAAPAHALQWMRENLKEEFDGLLLLQPTSPLRRPYSIVYACTRWSETPEVSSVSCCVEGVPNGAIYVIGAKRLEQARNWGFATARWFKMPVTESVDVDCEQDLAWAEELHAQEYACV